MEGKTKKKRVEKRAVRKKKDVVTNLPKPETAEPKKKKAGKRAKPTASRRAPTYEQVQLRAYFISEQRRHRGTAGDEHTDWVRAEKELRDELLVERVSVRD
jgi:hypothetical protein